MFACCRVIVTNSSNNLGTFSYQECNNTIWNYGVKIGPNSTKNIWAIENTISTAFIANVTFDIDCNYLPETDPTPTPTPSITPTNTPTPSITPTITPTKTLTPTPTPSSTPDCFQSVFIFIPNL
jgi:hypothetical protein